ncbi:hypothetical protein ACSBR1_031412 [Camellia fascicularis]
MNADEQHNEPESSYFNLLALDVSIAFPQATPASIFPPCSNIDKFYSYRDLWLGFDDLLTPEEQSIRMKYWEKAEFPFDVLPKLAALGIAGGSIKGYGCPGHSIAASAITMAEIARVDATLAGSETQKQKYLPSLAQLKTIGSWGLTEPGYGSDASSLKTTATKETALLQMCFVIFARNTTTKQINGFLVKKDALGLQATRIENKIGIRMVQNGDILLKKVFVPDEDKLPGINSFQDTNKVFVSTRLIVAWQLIDIPIGVYDMCHRYDIAWGELTNVHLFGYTLVKRLLSPLCPLLKIKL